MALNGLLPPDVRTDELRLPRARRMGTDSGIDMTPMIDVTFLLLIFFMVTNTLISQSNIELPPAVYGVGVDPAAATIVTLKAPEGGGPAKIVLGGDEGEQADEAEVRRWVEEGLTRGRAVVVVNAEGRVAAGQVRRILQAISDIEGITLHVGVGEKR